MRRPGDNAALVGRDEELSLVDALLAGGREQGDVLLLHGDPGVGKSSLAAVAVARAEGTVLTTTGVPSEAEVAYAGLQQLLWPVLDEADSLPAPQRAVLDAAMGVSGEAPKDPFRTGLAVLGLLGDVAERAPVVVVAEDAHWLDEPTCAVLAFVARRIEADPIAMLITSRESIPRSLRGLPSRRLAPLPADAAEALLQTLDPRLAAGTRNRILAQAEGNPLGLVELLAGAARAEVDLPEYLPLSTRLERTFAARVADLPLATRMALLVAALTDRADVTEVLAAAGRVWGEPLGLDVFTPAVGAGLVDVDEQQVRFGHPLMRSAIAQGGPETQRQAAHEALASTLAGDPARAVWHRVAASLGPDDELADELTRVAQRAVRRGSVVTAAETLGRAAVLTGDEAARGARLLDAAELALDIGRDDLVERLLTDAGPLVLAPSDQPRRFWLQRIAYRRAPTPGWFEAHLDRIDELDDPGRASQALLTIAFRAWWSPVPFELRERMVAHARALPRGGPPEVIAMVVLSLAGPEEHGAEVAEWMEQVSLDALPGELLRLVAVCGPIVGAFDRGMVISDRAIERLRVRGRYGLLATALVSRAWAGVHAGAWSASLAAAQNARIVAQETVQPLWVVAALAAEAALTGLRGDAERAFALAAESEAALPSGEADSMRSMIEFARGLACLGADRPSDAFGHLRRVLDPEEPWYSGFVARWVVADAVEAAVRANAFDAGRAVLERAEGCTRPSRHLAASIGFARVLLAPEAEVDARAEEALRLCVELPALRARVQLAYGAALRRRRRAGEARALLRAARDTFEALDIAPGAEHARRELRAAGEAVRTTTVDPATVLSPQELQIARMAAEGLSNREIGQVLYLSHRTIGSHLYRVYPKLGIASRGELRAVLHS